jgi:hypothetical protein
MRAIFKTYWADRSILHALPDVNMNNAPQRMRLSRAALPTISTLALVLHTLTGPYALAAEVGPKAPEYWLSGEDFVTIKDKNRSDQPITSISSALARHGHPPRQS